MEYIAAPRSDGYAAIARAFAVDAVANIRLAAARDDDIPDGDIRSATYAVRRYAESSGQSFTVAMREIREAAWAIEEMNRSLTKAR